ncbi:4-hydroxybenzoyl-CoA thioesterase [Pseudomonas taeanensis MS-3]|jgi:acyl-CoA thioester hydrolase|uniref:4-hydroxybenzoyl-CoA thioesterase n=1 Tax=Pseudomonas taeanensis MS-3 TaxID=1395571 RepID=A0A0A1YKR5_9PSED|nr:thioesterase family protein [Pseudomonas taeanensis]KFX70480.1 4-hydroxybenzoyl-CoA thioesterase [Pseudomonas taeanensis MS-3]
MPTPTALTTYQTPVLPEWVDYNGHLRDAFYLLIFSFATDSLMDHLGLDEAGRARTGHTLYTLECHLNYLAEVKLGAEVEVRTQVLAHDRKRLHIHHGLYYPGGDELLAASEQMLMNMDSQTGRPAVFAAEVESRVVQLGEAHRLLPPSAYVGRLIGLPARAS